MNSQVMQETMLQLGLSKGGWLTLACVGSRKFLVGKLTLKSQLEAATTAISSTVEL